MTQVYVITEEKNYKHNIYCIKKKNQQWNQFQQIKQKCVLGMEPKLQKHSTPAVQGGSL